MSMEFSFDQGPQVLVDVSLNRGVIQRVHLQFSEKFKVCMSECSQELLEWCESYAKGQQPTCHLLFNFDDLTDFRKRVLCELEKIPFGHSKSYQELAELCGCEKGARAAGGACGANPCPLFIPCHRILASEGILGGFSQGLEIKKRLLDFEKIPYREN